MPYLDTHNNERKYYYCDFNFTSCYWECEEWEKSFRQKLGEQEHSRDGQRKGNVQRNLRPKGQRERRKTKDSCHGIKDRLPRRMTCSQVTAMWQSWDRNPCCWAQYSYGLLLHSDAFTSEWHSWGPLRTTFRQSRWLSSIKKQTKKKPLKTQPGKFLSKWQVPRVWSIMNAGRFIRRTRGKKGKPWLPLREGWYFYKADLCSIRI